MDGALDPHAYLGSEGWVWSEGATSLLIAKHNDANFEWSLLEPIQRGDETLIRFGGAGQWKHGHPEGSSRLEPGASYTFGETRIQLVEGGLATRLLRVSSIH